MKENEYDPISAWSGAIGSRLKMLGWLMVLLAFVLCLVAPAFGPAIKQIKRNQYVLYSDYEARAEADMKVIRPILWVVAFISWMLFLYCQIAR